MSMNNKQSILDTFLERVWIFDDIFWKNTDKVIYDREREKARNILKNVYKYENVDLFFPPEIDDYRFQNTLTTLFRFSGNNSLDEQLNNANNNLINK